MGNGITDAVQKQTQWLEVHITTLGNRSWVFVIWENYWVVMDHTDVIVCNLYSNFLAYNVTKSDEDLTGRGHV
jgi:hypothetical protein